MNGSNIAVGEVPPSFEWIEMWCKKWPLSIPTPPLIPDTQYSSYYPQYHQPLQMLLGKPLYLEVRLLNTPDPSLVLLVHFCVAYPRSGKAVWLLLYNGYTSKFFLCEEKTNKKKWHFESDFHWQEMMRKMKEVYFWYLLSCFLIGWWISCHSIDVPIPWTQPHSRLCCLILSHPLLGVRPGVSPSAPSSSFLMVSSRTRKRR